MVQYAVGDLISDGRRGRSAGQLFDDLELDLHPVRADAFDVHGNPVSGLEIFPGVCQTGEVGSQLNEGTVLLDGADDAPTVSPG